VAYHTSLQAVVTDVVVDGEVMVQLDMIQRSVTESEEFFGGFFV